MSPPDNTWQGELRLPLAVGRSFMLHNMGQFDPSTRLGTALLWRAVHTPEGPATIRLEVKNQTTADLKLWGPGARAIDIDGLLGQRDNLEGFNPEGAVRRVAGSNGGLRLPVMPDLMRTMVQIILQQRITWKEAARSFRLLVQRFGSVAPGPASEDPERPLMLPPEPRAWAKITFSDYAAAGVEKHRAQTIVGVSRSARAFEQMCSLAPEQAQSKLRAFRGVGPWTVGNFLPMTLGWADGVPLADIELPHLMCWFLAKEPRGSDERMLELLEPYRGHRWRVVCLAHASGIKRPRFAPRKAKGPAPGWRRRR